MAKYKKGLSLDVDSTSTMRQLGYRFEDLGKPEVMSEAAEIMLDYINEYVPKKTGNLRASAKIKAIPKKVTITWGGDGRSRVSRYAHYQFAGTVYGPNIPVFRGGVQTSKWISPKGRKKQPTSRRLGEGGQYVDKRGRVVVIDGYTTPGTTSDWIANAKRSSGWRSVRLDVTKYLKKRLRDG